MNHLVADECFDASGRPLGVVSFGRQEPCRCDGFWPCILHLEAEQGAEDSRLGLDNCSLLT
jgi:hypothetical protein